MMRGMKAAARTVAARLGIEDQLRHAWQHARPAVRRDLAERAHLRRLVAWTVPRDGHCIDVGCHAGDVLRDLVRAAPGGRHIAYEPLPELAAALTREFGGVDVRCRALADEAGEREFTRVVGNPGWSGFRERPTPGAERFERLTVAVERLDDALPDGFRPAFVKIDVEGAELEVLTGALETLRTFQPVVAFEHGRGSADHYGTEPGDVFALLADRAGLRIYDLDGAGPYTLLDFTTAFETGRRVNFVARS
jgi:FkbM family methyltransferase